MNPFRALAARIDEWRRMRSGQSSTLWFECSHEGCNTSVGQTFYGEPRPGMDEGLVQTARRHGWTVTDDEALCRRHSSAS